MGGFVRIKGDDDDDDDDDDGFFPTYGFPEIRGFTLLNPSFGVSLLVVFGRYNLTRMMMGKSFWIDDKSLLEKW